MKKLTNKTKKLISTISTNSDLTTTELLEFSTELSYYLGKIIYVTSVSFNHTSVSVKFYNNNLDSLAWFNTIYDKNILRGCKIYLVDDEESSSKDTTITIKLIDNTIHIGSDYFSTEILEDDIDEFSTELYLSEFLSRINYPCTSKMLLRIVRFYIDTIRTGYEVTLLELDTDPELQERLIMMCEHIV